MSHATSNSSKKVYTVTFNSNGGSEVADVEVTEGEKVAKPADPTYAGYVFKYWSLDGTTEFDFEAAITGDITLKAVWKPLGVGDTLTLGTITWKVLKVDEDKTALLISQDILSSCVFDSDTSNHTASNDYEPSFIREYINGRNTKSNFLEYYGLKTDYMVKVDVISDIEKTTKNTGSDYVFLLSWTEANNTEYFADDAARVANYGGSNIYWWLRSPSDADGTKNACNVTAGGSIMNNTYSTKPSMPAKDMLGLRPAFWYKWN